MLATSYHRAITTGYLSYNHSSLKNWEERQFQISQVTHNGCQTMQRRSISASPDPVNASLFPTSKCNSEKHSWLCQDHFLCNIKQICSSCPHPLVFFIFVEKRLGSRHCSVACSFSPLSWPPVSQKKPISETTEAASAITNRQKPLQVPEQVCEIHGTHAAPPRTHPTSLLHPPKDSKIVPLKFSGILKISRDFKNGIGMETVYILLPSPFYPAPTI